MRAGDVAMESVTAAIIAGQISVGALVGTIVAARMVSQAVDAMEVGDAAFPQIGFHDRASNRLRHGEQATCRFREPVGVGDRGGRLSDLGSDRGRFRKRRASSATSWKSTKPQLSRITSSKSPCSPVAASVHLPARRPPVSRLSGAQTSSGRTCS